MMRYASVAMAGLVLSLSGCGGATPEGKLPPGKDSGERTRSGIAVSKEAARNFESGLDTFVRHDLAFDWAESSCKEVASMFMKAAEAQESDTKRAFPSALYNAGLAYQRCGLDADARKQFEAALGADKGFHRAAAQLALYDYQKTKDLDGTINRLNQIIRDAKFQNVEALVSVAALQMERASDQSDSDGPNDLARALKNIQRALAIDDSFMPAFNQLAIYYMEQAKAKAGDRSGRRRGLEVAGAEKKVLNRQMLDLAALVASQAVQKNPRYAAIHNTVGLIMVEQQNYNGAVNSFKTARQLDPKFFEAHMNYAAVNLGFRGFGEAEKAYRDALKLRPQEFEAHLGLALALRGQIDPSNWDKAVAEAQKHLDEAKKIDSSRPETYYNEAILTQEYKAKAGSEEAAIPMLKKSVGIYEQFISKAGSDEAFAEAVKRSRERVQDIKDTVQFIEDGIQMKKQEEQLAKQAAAAKKAEAAKKPPAKADNKPKADDKKK